MWKRVIREEKYGSNHNQLMFRKKVIYFSWEIDGYRGEQNEPGGKKDYPKINCQKKR